MSTTWTHPADPVLPRLFLSDWDHILCEPSCNFTQALSKHQCNSCYFVACPDFATHRTVRHLRQAHQCQPSQQEIKSPKSLAGNKLGNISVALTWLKELLNGKLLSQSSPLALSFCISTLQRFNVINPRHILVCETRACQQTRNTCKKPQSQQLQSSQRWTNIIYSHYHAPHMFNPI